MGLGDIARDTGRTTTSAGRAVADIITFIESSWGLGFKLFPVQRVILKAHYGEALDDNEHGYPLDSPVPVDHPNYDASLMDKDGFYDLRIVISDWKRQNYKYLTEAGYLQFLFDEGRCNIKEVVQGHERREMILSIGRRSGKCLTGDTLVLTDAGVRRIEELGDPDGPEYQPLEVGVAQEGRKTRAVSKFFYNGGVKPVFKLKTQCGFKLGGTGNHRVKVMTPEGRVEWVYLADIREGDQVAIHRGTELWAPEQVDLRPHHNIQGYKDFEFPDTLNDRLGLLLGLLVGDGNWKNIHSVAFTADDPETKACAAELLTEFFGEPSFTPDKRRERTGALRVHGTGARQFLHDIGWVYDSDRRSKMVPWSLMQSPAPVVCAFLRGLFETDGGVESDGGVVSFCSASERLAHEVQTLLLNLGIVSRVRAKWDKTYERDYYVLTVRGLRHRQRFAERVGFVSRRKMDPLWAGLKSAGREGGNAESIPHLRDWGARLLASVKASSPGQGWSRSNLRAVLGNTLKPSSKEQMTYPRLEKTLVEARRLGADLEVIEHLQELHDLDYFYDPVVSVEQGEEAVYDLNVPQGSMFVANGMTNHNTTISACVAAYETYKLLSKGDPQDYYGLPHSNVIQLISVATDKDQAGLLYREVSGHFGKCFAAETPIVTDEGVRAIGDLVGTSPTVLTRDGSWVEAPVRSFGEQQLYKLVIRRQGVRKTLFATAEHRWFVLSQEGSYEATTVSLTPGDCLETVGLGEVAWTVESVEPTDRVEEVFCATVEGHGDFVLEGNIATGNCDFFAPYMANNTMSYANFQTPHDIAQYGTYAEDPQARSSIKVTFRSCVAKGLRGAGNILVILDEVAHFTDAGQSGADAVYQAVTPSTSAYSPKDPTDHRVPIGEVEGRIILISSPLGKQGLFWDQFRIGFTGSGAANNMLCVQAPTWEVNPTIPAHEFEKHYLKDVRVFFTEYGAYFTDRTRGWIVDPADLLACVDPAARPQFRSRARMPHFLGFDFALVGDASAVAIGHVEGNRIHVDLVDCIQANQGKYAEHDRLQMDWVADWLQDLASRFYIVEGLFDQWSGIPLEQALEARGLNQMKSEKLTAPLTSAMFRNFYNMMIEKRIVLYNWPRPIDDKGEEGHVAYIAELLKLQAEFQSKYVTLVEAPRGGHDDMSDALVRMVWQATQAMGSGAHLAGGKFSGSRISSPTSGSMAEARRRALLGGSDIKRQNPEKARAGGMSPYRGMTLVAHGKKKKR